MKKTISINISGIVFHIEDDGYDKLRNYLDSINRYFSTYEDSQEIIADIENRIAEIFSAKLNTEKEVITAEDVSSLITTMGTISDFKAVEEEEDKNPSSFAEESKSSGSYSSGTFNETTQTSKRLYRDEKRKLIGGVAAGLAGYFEVDPIWIRLAIIALFFGFSFLPAMSGFIAIAYIVLWFVLPVGIITEEEDNIKKLYRNPDNKVISGVCSGLAAYFGTDITVIRVLFVLGLFLGGSTIVLYLVLWAITPEAHTITEKMKMQGEPVTLSNIETNVKKNLNLADDKEENPLTKILLFPFRVIAIILSGIAKILGPALLVVGEVVRIVFGSLLILVPLGLFISLVFALAVIYGVTDHGFIFNTDLPVDTIISGVPKVAALAAFGTLVIPIIFIGIIGATVLAKKRVVHPAFGLTLLGLFIISLVFTAFTVPSIVKDYRRKAKFEEEIVFPMRYKTFTLKGNANDDVDYAKVDLFLRGYSGTEVKLVKEFSARGFNKSEAIKNAHMIDYNVVQKDSSIVFDWDFTFNENAVFRAQDLDLTLYIPYGKEFYIDEDMDEIIRSPWIHGNQWYNKLEGGKWVFEEDGMRCLECEEEGDYNFNFHSDYKAEGLVQAEDYKSMNNVTIEDCQDTGGGKALGYIQNGSWMAYKIEVPKDGVYTIKLRVASSEGDGKIRIESLGGAEEFGRISIPNTGGWQNWRTISRTVNLKKGFDEIVFFAENGGFNFNWFSITPGRSVTPADEYDNDDDDFSMNFDFDDDDDIGKDVRNYNLTNFTGLSISGLFLINVIKGNEYKVKLSGTDNAIDKLDVKVEDHSLNIKMRDEENGWKNRSKRIRIDITMPDLKKLDINGLTKSYVKGFNSDHLKMDLNGASFADFDINTRTLDLDISGGAKVILKGRADEANVDISGAADFNGFDFVVRKAEIDIAGASATKINVTDFLKIDADGPCDIRYKGTPRIDQDLSILSHMEKED
jgi:phage shock protein PspC (stress-responsive transcriptional regulator)